MALLPGISTALVSQFSGATPLGDSYDNDPAHGLYARNMQYIRGQGGLNQCGTRLGHAQVAALNSGDGGLTTLYNWYFVYSGSQISLALYYAPAIGVKAYNQTSAAFTGVLINVTGAAGAVFVAAGQRVYAAYYDSTGRLGTAGGNVYGWSLGSDVLFAPPLTTPSPVVTPNGSGSVTIGAHSFGYMTTTRNGYTGTLQPIQTTALSPVGYEIISVGYSSSTNDTVRFTLTFGSLPSYLSGGVSSVQVIMTTVDNPNQWWAVPGAVFTPAVGANIIDISISDATLVATAADVTDRLNLLVTLGSTPPFKPNSIFAYSSRMGYCTIDGSGTPTVYISNQNDFQYVTADQHGIVLEGEALPVAGVSLHGILYITTNAAFYSTVDNGGVPVSWTPPARVDGSVGVLSPTCLLENTASGYILVASGSGLFVFQGSVFPELPISYYQKPDWDRINWAIPTQIQVAEDILNRRFLVMAPLSCTVSLKQTSGGSVLVSTVQPHLFQAGLTVNGVVITSIPDALTFAVASGDGGAFTAGGLAIPAAANCVLSWDYTEGKTPDTAKYSIQAMSAYRMGCVGRIQNLSNSLQEIWYGPAASSPNGNIIRAVTPQDAHPNRDVTLANAAAAIDSLYQTSNLPGSQDESNTLHDYHGAHFRMTGSGNLAIQANNLDGTLNVIPAASPVSLSNGPGKEILVRWFLRSEQQTIQFGTNAVDEYFVMALIRCYFTNAMPQR